MIINGATSLEDTNISDKQGDVKVQSYSIELNPVAMELLSRNPYSNPVRAVIRELACNAFDSHVMAGRGNVPITIIMPTTLSPEFVVRDDGLGLSDDEVLRLFSTFFASNKRQSNATTGGFGIGSKAPFAVSNTFTVESRYNGKKSVFVATKDSGGPKIVRMASAATDECNGVTVRVPVPDRHTHNTWYTEAQYVLENFAVIPNVKGIDFKAPTISYESDLVRVIKLDTNDWRNANRVLMGNVTYSGIGAGVSASYGHQTLIKLPNGSVSPNLNRETLAYDEAAKLFVAQRRELALKEMSAFISAFVDTQNPQSLIEACVIANDFAKKTFFVDDWLYTYDKYPVSSSKFGKLTPKYEATTKYHSGPINTYRVHCSDIANRLPTVNNITKKDISGKVTDYIGYEVGRYIYNRIEKPITGSHGGALVVIMDVNPSKPSEFNSRLRQLKVDWQGNETIYVHTFAVDKYDEWLAYRGFDNPYCRDALKALGVHYYSQLKDYTITLPKVARAPSVTKPFSECIAAVMCLSSDNHNVRKCFVGGSEVQGIELDHTAPEPRYFLPTFGDNAPSSYFSSADWWRTSQVMQDCFRDKTVYMFTHEAMKRYEKAPQSVKDKWINVSTPEFWLDFVSKSKYFQGHSISKAQEITQFSRVMDNFTSTNFNTSDLLSCIRSLDKNLELTRVRDVLKQYLEHVTYTKLSNTTMDNLLSGGSSYLDAFTKNGTAPNLVHDMISKHDKSNDYTHLVKMYNVMTKVLCKYNVILSKVTCKDAETMVKLMINHKLFT